MNRRTLGIGILVLVVGFYTFGTGFTFFFSFLYTLLLVLALGLVWAWINLQGLEVKLVRTATRGQVGGYLEARIEIHNRTRLPKSWLEVAEVTDLPVESAGRGLALVREQTRSWRIETHLTRRGVFQTGQVEVVSQDPFGLFVLRRRFFEPNTYVVVPATVPLPDLHPQLAGLPLDSRFTQPSGQVTTDVSSIRAYAYGDSYRRIHWPYTARMNSLMVKEFDVGISAESWVVLDMHQLAHFGLAPDNTEELAVTVAASLVNRMFECSLPVGLASNGDFNYVLRPGQQPGRPGTVDGDIGRGKGPGDHLCGTVLVRASSQPEPVQHADFGHAFSGHSLGARAQCPAAPGGSGFRCAYRRRELRQTLVRHQYSNGLVT